MFFSYDSFQYRLLSKSDAKSSKKWFLHKIALITKLQ